MSGTARHETSAKGDRRRAQILDNAVQLFGEVGYRGASLRDIATRVGITHPGLLYHFHSKEELLLEVLARRDQDNQARFEPGEQSSPLERLHGIVSLVSHNASRHGMVELFSTLSAEATDPSHPAHTYFTLRYEMVTDLYTSLFVELADQGLLGQGMTPQAAARCLVALMDGLQVQWLYDEASVDMAGDVRAFLDTVLVRPLAHLEAEAGLQVEAVELTDPAA